MLDRATLNDAEQAAWQRTYDDVLTQTDDTARAEAAAWGTVSLLGYKAGTSIHNIYYLLKLLFCKF